MAVGDGWFGLRDWWDGLFGVRAKLTEPDARRDAEAAAHGPPVSPEAALRISVVWSCVRLLSETVGTLPLGVYRKDALGRRLVAADHGLYGLLHDSPNGDQTAAEFVEAMVAFLATWGNFYAEKVSIGPRLIALQILPAPNVTVRRGPTGRRLYVVVANGVARTLDEDSVFHVRGFGFGGDTGLPPIGYARRTLGVSIAADDAASNALRLGVRPAGFLAEPATGKSTPDQRQQMRETVLDPITGPGGAGRAAIIPAGWTWNNVSGLPPEDLQILETRGFHIEELCRWFRVPPPMIGHMDKQSSWPTSLEQQTLIFLTYALRPYLVRIEQAVRKQLCTDADRAQGVYAEFTLEGLMRADSTGRAALYASAAQNGWMTRNEIRALENLPPVEGGDVITVQVNLVPLSQLGVEPTPEGLKMLRLAHGLSAAPLALAA